MKTVMKKMFCLMLVAVLMAGTMPFQAFAEEFTVEFQIQYPDGTLDVHTQPSNGATYNAQAALDCYAAGWSSSYEIDQVWKDGSQVDVTTFTDADHNCALGVVLKEKHVHNYSEATCTTPPTCSCGATNGSVNENNHTSEVIDNAVAATCTEAGLTEGTRCSACGTVITAQTPVAATGHTEIATPDVAATCTTAGQTGGKHCSVCNTVTVTPVAVPALGHTPGAAATCTTPQICTVCNAQITAALGHNVVDGKCTRCYVAPQTGNHSLNVWAKLWVGETLNKTILLDTITGLSGNDVVAYVIGNNVSRLQSKFPSGYNNIEWTKAVYYEIDSKTTGTVDTKMKVAEEGNVFINLYSTEKLVVVRVHTGKTYHVDRSVQVGGFRVGETVTYNDVLKAVQKYYNVSSMKMYTYGEWEKVVNGGNGATTPNFLVHEGDNVYDVYLTGSAKTSTTASNKKADSTNPKTGDMIFAPAMVLGLSASALVVLYYLNKKRAF